VTERVALADGSAPTRAGLRLALERGGLEVCAQAAHAGELLELALRCAPDLVLVAADLPGDALAAVEQLAGVPPRARIVVMTAAESDDELVAAVLAGASGYVGKDISPARLPHIVRAVLRGEAAVPRRRTERLLAEVRIRRRRGGMVAPRVRSALSDREWEVLEQLAEGHGTAEIARRAGISQVTARRHISNLVRKLGVADRAAAVALLGERGGNVHGREH
jgi:DNA-binding NarL/FixJ family response regulator